MTHMEHQETITLEQMHFAVFCIESMADELAVSGDNIYKVFTEDSDILDNYILPCYDSLHTQGKEYIIDELKRLMLKRGLSA